MLEGSQPDGDMQPEAVSPAFFRGVRIGLIMVLPFWGGIIWLVCHYR
jgi:hypothetical protein